MPEISTTIVSREGLDVHNLIMPNKHWDYFNNSNPSSSSHNGQHKFYQNTIVEMNSLKKIGNTLTWLSQPSI